MTKQTSISVLIAFLVAAIATQAIFAHLENSPQILSTPLDPHSGLLALDVESIESEEKQESSDGGSEHSIRNSKPEKLATSGPAAVNGDTKPHTSRSDLGALRTRAP